MRYHLRWPFKNIGMLCAAQCILSGCYDKICRPSFDLCLEAYPSSGNTFLLRLLKEINPALRIGHHTHSIANIRLALRFKVPVITIVRHSLAAVSSRKARINAKKYISPLTPDLETALWDYSAFYNFIYNNRQNILLIDFRQLISQPQKSIAAISRFAKLDFAINDPIGVVVDRAKINLEKITRREQRGEDIEILSLPVKERDEAKLEISKQVISHPRYNAAFAIYEKLEPFFAV